MALPHLKSLKKPLPPLRLSIRGDTILTRPRFNKGTAFPLAERQSFGLVGRLPQKINTLEEQCARAYEQLQSRETPIRKNSFLQSLKDQNWTLYYALISRHLKELVPVIYTPTQAEAIMNYSHLFRRSEGLYLTFTDQDTMERDFLEQTRGREIDLFVVTDSEAILGIGDQGVGGIGISTAKSVMYTLIGGLDPAKSVAVVLDVGTNNEKLLNDPLYVGWREKRVRGEAYDKFVDKFIQLIRKHHPHSLLHFEDFGVTNAYRLLERYRETHAVFNDDIQGTGAVTLACTMSALGVSPISQSSSPSSTSSQNKLSDQRYIIYGAGSAGLGIANQLRDAMVSADGVTREEANSKFYLIDREGLLAEQDGVDRESGLRGEYWRPLSESWSPTNNKLLDVVDKVKPTVLIGCSTSAGAFTKDVVQCMKDGLQGRRRAVIMPLSNPSRLVEATPEDILKWTKGEALVATGSPFGVVREGGREYKIAECNNALIYPGLGFGAILSQSRQITDTMLIAGAQRLAALSPAIRADKDSSSSSPGSEYTGESLLPDFSDAPRVNFEIGVAVAEQAVREGSAQVEFGEGEVRERASERVYVPEYREYVYEEGVE